MAIVAFLCLIVCTGYETNAQINERAKINLNGNIITGNETNAPSGTTTTALRHDTNLAPRPNKIEGAQAVAFRMEGDQAAFWGCGFYGYQDTLHDDKGRHYFRDCFIQGSIDFIFSDARSLYENCQLNSVAQPNGAITAQGRDSSEDNTGFAFVKCSITGTGRIWLGRAWGSYSRVIFAFTSMADVISPDGWTDMSNITSQQTVFYGEYVCTGPGADMSKRVPYARNLTYTQASPFLNASFIDGDQWLQPY